MTFNFGGLAKPMFGQPNFSAAPTTSASTGFGGFGGGFGAATSVAPPAFGANPVTTSTGFGGFGAGANTGFGGFGANPASTAAPSLFGSSFGVASTAGSTPFPSFNTATTSAGNTFGFGTAKPFGAAPAFGAPGTGFGTGAGTFGAPSTGFGTGVSGGFGAAAPSFGAGGFGAGSTGFGANTGFGGFGAPSTGFGANAPRLGAPTTGQPFAGYGTSFGTGLGFGQQQQQLQQQQQPVQNANEALMNAVFNCCRFGDERDQILAKWNFLQAKWGVGKAYYADNMPPLELTQQNPLCRFKAIGYSLLPCGEDKHGLVSLVFTKTEQEIKTNQAQFITALSGLLGNKPNITVHVDSISAVSDGKSQITIYVTEKPPSLIGQPPYLGSGTRAPASELSAALQSGNNRNTLAQAGCTGVIAQVAPSPSALRQYIDTPPAGIDVRLWKQAQADNPDPKKYIPVPMVGSSEVKWRSNVQAEHAKLQSAWEAQASEKVAALAAKRTDSTATADEARRRLMDLTRRLLKVTGKLETTRRIGQALSQEEEALKMRLHTLQAQLASPTLFNGRLSELLSQMRMQRCQSVSQSVERYVMDPDALEDVKQLLSLEHKGMVHLIDTINKHASDLKIVQEGLEQVVQESVS